MSCTAAKYPTTSRTNPHTGRRRPVCGTTVVISILFIVLAVSARGPRDCGAASGHTDRFTGSTSCTAVAIRHPAPNCAFRYHLERVRLWLRLLQQAWARTG